MFSLLVAFVFLGSSDHSNKISCNACKNDYYFMLFEKSKIELILLESKEIMSIIDNVDNSPREK